MASASFQVFWRDLARVGVRILRYTADLRTEIERQPPAGKTPVTFAVGGSRQKLSMITTVTNQGVVRILSGLAD